MKRTEKNGGFTLLEILVALSLMGIALLIIVRLFSADLRNITFSEDYVVAVAKAESQMREVLGDPKLSEKNISQTTEGNYQIDTSVTETLQDRTDKLQFKLFDVRLTVKWRKANREKSVVLRTLKAVKKEL
jgi:type II secretion system protein I